MFSRRKFIAAGAATGATALLPPALIRAVDGGASGTGDVSNFISILQASDPSFEFQVERLFPSLLQEPAFKQIKAHSVLITNVSGQAISAYSTVWTAITPDGTFSSTLSHYFHPSPKRPTRTIHFGKKGNKTRFTGKIPVLKVGATRLMTPYFNWSTRYYKAQRGKLDWHSILTAKPSRAFFFHKLLPASSIKVDIDAIILNHKEIIGPNTSHLGRMFRKSRNGEHDEALAILKLVQAGVSPKALAEILRQDAKLPLASSSETSVDPIYLAARKRLAKVLLLRLKHGKSEQFIRTLNYLVRQPKTMTGLHHATNIALGNGSLEGDVA